MTRKIKRVSIKRKNNTGCFSYFIVVALSAFLAVIVAFNLYLASLKPIDNFVEHIVIKKTVEPGLDYFSKSLSKE